MSFLHKEPSLSVYNVPISDGSREDDEKGQVLERSVTIGESIETEFSFQKKGMGLIEEEVEDQDQALDVVSSEPPCVGLGIGIGFDESNLPNLGEEADLEEYYKNMIEQCPFHPLFLRNYAQLLQSKGDLAGAEEYYSRASSADPDDDEIWMQYAKLVWDLHCDKDRALKYFELATEVAPNDCNVLAAYASFIWEIDDGSEEDETIQDQVELKESVAKLDEKKQASVTEGVGIDELVSVTTGSGNAENGEEYYRKIIEDNPNDALVLGNYAKFLCESKGNLQGAEEYYSRAVLYDPGNGEVTARYAKLVWDLHRDDHKATIFFERAVQASPENSDVLAAYASFLWEKGDDEED